MLAGSKLVADRFEAKFHYAIWFEACRRPASRPASNQLEPASVMEFGFTSATLRLVPRAMHLRVTLRLSVSVCSGVQRARKSTSVHGDTCRQKNSTAHRYVPTLSS